jgi:pyrroline-5-carboxylate reductase
VTEPDAEIGVLGVGAIAEAIVTGLGDDYLRKTPVLLSPRSRSRATALAERFPALKVAADNQDLIDRSRTVLLCVRPQHAGSTFEGLEFAADQRVISLVASISLEQMRQWVAPARVLARAIPLPAVARREGLTAIHPPEPRTRDLFNHLGGTLDVDDEETLRRAPTELAHLATDHATPGGLNEQFLEALRAADFLGLVERSLDQIENRVRGR